ncbi:MAG: LOG family protein [Candidatus Omnitrophota bacterium]
MMPRNVSSRSKTITLFGSFRPKPGTPDYLTAYQAGALLARAGFTLANGGFGGTMEASAKGAREAGGTTVGVVFSKHGLHANPYIGRLEKKKTLLGRLERLVTIADGYIVFKGGTGTLLEISLVLEYTHKQFSSPKPMVFLGEFWKETVATAQQEAGYDPRFHFTAQANQMMRLIRFVSSPQEAVQAFQEMFSHDVSQKKG